MLQIKRISEVIGKKVYTDGGDLFGDVEEVNIIDNKVESWRIRLAPGLGTFIAGAKGVIIPHQFVRAVGDIVIVAKTSLPVKEEVSPVEETGKESMGVVEPEY